MCEGFLHFTETIEAQYLFSNFLYPIYLYPIYFLSLSIYFSIDNCVKIVQIQSFFWSVFSCIRTEYGDSQVKSVQIRSFFWSVFPCIRTEYGDLRSPNTGKYRAEKTPYLDTFYAVIERCI